MGRITIEEIKKLVLIHFGMKERQVFRKTRKAEIVNIRFIYFYLCRKYTTSSFENIGFGTYCHATVLNGFKKIMGLIDINDYETLRHIREIEDSIPEDLFKEEDPCRNSLVDLRKLKAENMMLKSEVSHLKNRGMTKDEQNILSIFRDLNEVKKQDAIFKLSTILKIQDNMTHQKLRVS